MNCYRNVGGVLTPWGPFYHDYIYLYLCEKRYSWNVWQIVASHSLYEHKIWKNSNFGGGFTPDSNLYGVIKLLHLFEKLQFKIVTNCRYASYEHKMFEDSNEVGELSLKAYLMVASENIYDRAQRVNFLLIVISKSSSLVENRLLLKLS